jgi:predicted DNA-binding transcriptional regulator YafY
MTYSEKKGKEKHLLYLIQHHRLISLENLASDFDCSARTIKRMIANLRHEGYAIAYCRMEFKYYIKE